MQTTLPMFQIGSTREVINRSIIKHQNIAGSLESITNKSNKCQNQLLKTPLKKNQIKLLVEELRQKPTHGQFFQNIEQPHVDKTSSLLWLKSSTLKRSTEATICAIQEQAVTTRYIQHHVHHTSDNDRCRVCKEQKETIHHIINGCKVLAPTKYLKRHDNLGSMSTLFFFTKTKSQTRYPYGTYIIHLM